MKEENINTNNKKELNENLSSEEQDKTDLCGLNPAAGRKVSFSERPKGIIFGKTKGLYFQEGQKAPEESGWHLYPLSSGVYSYLKYNCLT